MHEKSIFKVTSKTATILTMLLLVSIAAQAQFTSGDSFQIIGGTEVAIDGLLLKPNFTKT